jgi:hypothetical protein
MVSTSSGAMASFDLMGNPELLLLDESSEGAGAAGRRAAARREDPRIEGARADHSFGGKGGSASLSRSSTACMRWKV